MGHESRTDSLTSSNKKITTFDEIQRLVRKLSLLVSRNNFDIRTGSQLSTYNSWCRIRECKLLLPKYTSGRDSFSVIKTAECVKICKEAAVKYFSRYNPRILLHDTEGKSKILSVRISSNSPEIQTRYIRNTSLGY
jgi:hypothetical protein